MKMEKAELKKLAFYCLFATVFFSWKNI